MDNPQPPGQPGQPGPPGPPGSPNPLPALEALLTQPFSELAKVANIMPINWTELPTLPFFVPSAIMKTDLYRGSMAYTIIQMQWRAQRKLTAEETQIVAVQKAKYLSTMAYAVPSIIGVSIAYTWRGRHSFRFPFYTPKDFRPDAFPTKRLSWLSGPQARIMWHSCRFAAYLAISQWAVSSFFISYGLTVRQAEFDGDPRLNNLRSSMKQAATARMANSKSPRMRKMAEQVQKIDEARGGPQALPQPAVVLPQRQRDQDDQSPQDQEFESDQQLEDERYQEEQQQYQQAYQPQSQQRFPSQYQKPPASGPQRPAQLPWAKKRDDNDDDSGLWRDDFDDDRQFDDASPVAPTEQRPKWQRPTSSGGSSWDRVRAQVAPKQRLDSSEGDVPPQGSKWSRVRANASSDADSSDKTTGDYVYSPKDEEKALAKDTAQKDFDDMLEKERRGENDADVRRKW